VGKAISNLTYPQLILFGNVNANTATALAPRNIGIKPM